MFPTIPAVADSIVVDLSSHALGCDWGVGGWLLLLLAFLFVPCVASLLKAMVHSLDASPRRATYRRPTLIVIRPPLLRNS